MNETERIDDFWAAVHDPARRPFAVELDPPETAELHRFLDAAAGLIEAGADVITLADCPGGRPRLDSCLTAAHLHARGIPALPHLAGRDRNALATQSLLMGLSALGLPAVLLVSGDQIAWDTGARGVYHFNSVRLLQFTQQLNESLASPLHLYAALNVSAPNFDAELRRAEQKLSVGAEALFTQPVLSAAALDNLRRARETLDVPLLGGIMPVVSRRNAEFMNAHVPGIVVDQAIVARYDGLERAAAEALAEELSVEIAGKIAPWVDGFYLMTPFTRTALMARTMEGIRRAGLTEC